MIKRREDATFPPKSAFRRWGNGEAVRAKVAAYCEDQPDLAKALEVLATHATVPEQPPDSLAKGFVYLLRSGKSYKLGRTNAVGRRLRELSIQLPQRPDTVPITETDDPEGIDNIGIDALQKSGRVGSGSCSRLKTFARSKSDASSSGLTMRSSGPCGMKFPVKIMRCGPHGRLA